MNPPPLLSVGSVRQSGSYRLSMGDLAIMEVPSDQDRLNKSLSLGRCDKVVVW